MKAAAAADFTKFPKKNQKRKNNWKNSYRIEKINKFIESEKG